jgi:hypothetical protein
MHKFYHAIMGRYALTLLFAQRNEIDEEEGAFAYQP